MGHQRRDGRRRFGFYLRFETIAGNSGNADGLLLSMLRQPGFSGSVSPRKEGTLLFPARIQRLQQFATAADGGHVLVILTEVPRGDHCTA